MEKILILFSGGRDSFLSTCKLIEEGFKVYMITFHNGCGLNPQSARVQADRIVKKYGKEKAEFLGIQDISAIFREFFLPYMNMKPKEISEEYGEITHSQFNCLSCRSAMYIWTIIQAKKLGIRYVATGARKSQGFVEQLPIMMEKFKEFFKDYDIEYLHPVYNLESKWELKNSLLQRGFIPKTLDPMCLLGVPLDKPQDKEIQDGAAKFFDKIIAKRSKEIIQRYLKI